MTWVLSHDVTGFPGDAEDWLLRDPVRNTVPLTVLRGLRGGVFRDDNLCGWFVEDDEIAGAVLHTPPYPLLLGAVPIRALGSLARELIAMDHAIPGISAPLEVAEAFTRLWWRPETRRRSERLYRLTTLAPNGGSGSSRTATAPDLDHLVGWFRAFQHEAHVDRDTDPTPVVSARTNREELVYWEAGGAPVSVAGFSQPIGGMSRIGPVYTPPELRGKGYGSAVTHAATTSALAAGASEVLLFTDLSNPTSNSIYQKLGYVPVGDYASVSFA
ncbi:GNAT family N-acetyltransferase [Herbidospora mongoliensis]|uniref:GNAT family N-acetyltransferase n=1 Tax=Herbidospora mongoliensis TaxID=688067 RepID=UPI00082F9E56|nr:GNAT family N-acetyltransferase [Herbidospora mongoliensis]